MRDFARHVVLAPWFEAPDEAKALVRQSIRAFYRHLAIEAVDGLLDLILLARELHDADAEHVLGELIREYERSGERKPPELATYVMELTRGAGRTKRREKNRRTTCSGISRSFTPWPPSVIDIDSHQRGTMARL
jgi:hypothetical protein